MALALVWLLGRETELPPLDTSGRDTSAGERDSCSRPNVPLPRGGGEEPVLLGLCTESWSSK